MWVSFGSIALSVYLGSKSPNAEQTENTITPSTPEEQIPAYVIAPYTKSEYPDIFKKYKKFIPRINKLRVDAAKQAISSKKCDMVSMSELDIERSTKNNFSVFIDCQNKARIYISEADIKSKKTLHTEKEKSWNEKEAMSMCMDYIRDSAKNPNSVDMHAFGGINHFTAETTGNVVVDIEFDAKNDINNELTFIAHCVFPPNKPGEFNIIKK